MRPFVMLIAVLMIGVMMMSITAMINEGTENYNVTVPTEYRKLYGQLNSSFDTFDTFTEEQVAGVENKGIVTDSSTSAKTLEGGFSFLIGLFKLPQQILALITIIGSYFNIPAWAVAAAFTFLIVAVLSGIIAIIFRTGES